ncbi:hypothetical protein HPB48_020345 [Haemaphysalis longicornis]|uniref:Uncharacterized protein n=1 Tax=Haemaphysalis longicornis TaxID=44386 RepID=A0A9J6GNT7_HAELO|nr:hypothetical protein HPB48_020345 [Haemaphysalis longicornis]
MDNPVGEVILGNVAEVRDAATTNVIWRGQQHTSISSKEHPASKRMSKYSKVNDNSRRPNQNASPPSVRKVNEELRKCGETRGPATCICHQPIQHKPNEARFDSERRLHSSVLLRVGWQESYT